MPLLAGAEPYTADGAAGAPGALLVHGFTGSPQSMRPWAEYLAAAGLTVRLPRLPGHGTRWQDLNATRWPDWYAQAERGLTELSGRCPDVFVMGLSMGGTLALRLAEEHPGEVSGLVLVNPSLTTEDKRARLLPLLSRVLPSMPPIGNDIKKPGVTEMAYDRLPLRAAASLSRLWEQVRADLASVVAPLLLLRSATDHVVEPVNGRILLAGVSSAVAEERILPDSYHVATLDNDAETIFLESLAFVRRFTRAAPD
jgi:carboxylesterase